MSRYYMHCPQCRRRMRMFRDDPEGDRRFYLCPGCGNRGIYMPNTNGWSDGWPRKVFNEAVREGVLTRKGAVAS